jgi:hypothetical protein
MVFPSAIPRRPPCTTCELRRRGCDLEFLEIEVVAADAEVFDDVGDDAARHVAGMPRKRDEPVGPEGIGIMPVAPRCAKQFTADFTESALQLTAVVCGKFAHKSGGQDEFVAEGGRNGASGFEQRFQMRLGGLLESQGGIAPVTPVRMATGQQVGFRNPHPVFILTKPHFGKWNDHDEVKIACFLSSVKKRRRMPDVFNDFRLDSRQILRNLRFNDLH